MCIQTLAGLPYMLHTPKLNKLFAPSLLTWCCLTHSPIHRQQHYKHKGTQHETLHIKPQCATQQGGDTLPHACNEQFLSRAT